MFDNKSTTFTPDSVNLSHAERHTLCILSRQPAFLSHDNPPNTRERYAKLSHRGLIVAFRYEWDGVWFHITIAGRQALEDEVK